MGFPEGFSVSGSSSVLLTGNFFLSDLMSLLYCPSSAFPSPFVYTLSRGYGMSSDKIQISPVGAAAGWLAPLLRRFPG